MRDVFLQRVDETIRRRRMLAERDSILVAVSGGPDSVALLAALVALGQKRWRIGVAHVNHRLRGTASDADERFVERLAATFGLELFVRKGALRPGNNLEERARLRRYAILSNIAKAEGFRRIATGHTLDDQAETLLLRLLRGAGVTGLSGILPVREDGVVRPLLDSPRADVLAFLERKKLGYRRDATNQSARFTRNRIRRRLLPLLEREFNPSVRATLARTARLLLEDETFLERQAGLAARRTISPRGLDAPGLIRLAPALQRRVVRLWLVAARGSLRRITLEHVDVVRSLARVAGGRLSLPGGTIVRTGRWLRWTAPEEPKAPVIDVRLPGAGWIVAGDWRFRSFRRSKSSPCTSPGPWRAIFDARALDADPVRVRSPRAGDRIHPIGLRGTKKLQDVFVDAKVPRDERARWALVDCPSRILWVPGLVRSDAAPVTSESDEVLVIEARRIRAGSDVAGQNPMCYGRKRRLNVPGKEPT